jgi:hypothetical protein
MWHACKRDAYEVLLINVKKGTILQNLGIHRTLIFISYLSGMEKTGLDSTGSGLEHLVSSRSKTQ